VGDGTDAPRVNNASEKGMKSPMIETLTARTIFRILNWNGWNNYLAIDSVMTKESSVCANLRHP
jgi:hypothetical protein